MAKEFTLNGKSVTVQDLTVGDLRKMQKLIKGKDELDFPMIMIGYCCNITEDEFDALPLNSLKEIEAISDYIGSALEGK